MKLEEEMLNELKKKGSTNYRGLTIFDANKEEKTQLIVFDGDKSLDIEHNSNKDDFDTALRVIT